MQTTLQDLHGMYVGDLNQYELDLFTEGMRENLVRRVYIDGQCSLAKIVVLDREEHTTNRLVEDISE